MSFAELTFLDHFSHPTALIIWLLLYGSPDKSIRLQLLENSSTQTISNIHSCSRTRLHRCRKKVLALNTVWGLHLLLVSQRVSSRHIQSHCSGLTTPFRPRSSVCSDDKDAWQPQTLLTFPSSLIFNAPCCTLSFSALQLIPRLLAFSTEGSRAFSRSDMNHFSSITSFIHCLKTHLFKQSYSL